MKLLVSVSALLLLCAAPAMARQVAEELTPGAQQTYEGIAFRTGGVGLEEREALTQGSRGFPLKLLFAHKDDLRPPLAASVSVEMFDENARKVFEAHDAGPLLFVDMPPGKYRVVATLNGRTQEETFTLANAQKQVAIYF